MTETGTKLRLRCSLSVATTKLETSAGAARLSHEERIANFSKLHGLWPGKKEQMGARLHAAPSEPVAPRPLPMIISAGGLISFRTRETTPASPRDAPVSMTSDCTETQKGKR